MIIDQIINNVRQTEIGGAGLALCTIFSSYSIPHLNANDAAVLIAVFTTILQIYKLHIDRKDRKKYENDQSNENERSG